MDKPIQDRAIDEVEAYILSHLDKSAPKPFFEVYIVWQCYILGNWKCLVSSTLPDGMYYEVTYNSEEDDIYLDAYKRLEHIERPY